MTNEDTRKMFQLNAELRKIPPCDPRYEQGKAALDAMTARYIAENLGSGPAASAPGSDWQSALGYVAGLFQRLDACESDESMVAFRKKVWETITDAVQTFYQDPELEKKREHISKLRKMAEANAPKPQP